MGKRVVSISGELFTAWITKGWQCGGPDTVVRCIEGLPAGAKYEGADLVESWHSGSEEPLRFTVDLIYSHPDWPEDDAMPYQQVEYSMAYLGEGNDESSV